MMKKIMILAFEPTLTVYLISIPFELTPKGLF